MKWDITGAPYVTANNHATFTIQIQGRLRDYLRLLMGHPVHYAYMRNESVLVIWILYAQ